ncbi:MULTISPECIES: MFS transporter [unclassified Sulfitobacter]|uniref:MFS transporter n=1 Tax=Sulfitobacter TaxID=60136 RepID=UPI000066A68E|nr:MULTISPECIES: MFS transporter [unclassified Sulfitobacter]AXI49544.1 MFS transporter [Sulfitobacter sp. SK025]EAP82305.1 membrane protein, putative [Sulfitobacter sp. NAS-14.1]MAJ76479.1 MFS transporter [Roseobacter sp.]
MTRGVALLGLGYVLSQFFRAFLAVLSPSLRVDLGATPEDLAFASGLWFFSFAAMQLPVGWALDTVGPRRTAASLLLVGGGGGAALFAVATQPLHINLAMVLIGIGCAPVLMGAYYIFAREFAPSRFVVLASVMVGIGTLGNLVASYPMAIAAETIGWRASLWGLCAITTLTAVGIWSVVRDPATPEGEQRGSLLGVFKIKALWFIFPIMSVSYAQVGALRGLWIGPYFEDVFAANAHQIGWATLLMGIAMVAGSLAYGPLDRVIGSTKWVIVGGTALNLAALVALMLFPDSGIILATALMAAVGFFGATYAVIIAHGRSFMPPQLVGRGMTLLNLCSIGGVGVAQFLSGRVYAASQPAVTAQAPYVMIFTLFAGLMAAGLFVYLFSRDAGE